MPLCIFVTCGWRWPINSANGLLAVILPVLNLEHCNDQDNNSVGDIFLSYPTQKNLRLHEALHATDSLVCPECEKTFRRMASFKAHLAVHEEDESVTCEICQEEFISLVGAGGG